MFQTVNTQEWPVLKITCDQMQILDFCPIGSLQTKLHDPLIIAVDLVMLRGF